MGATEDLTVNFADILESVADAVPEQLFLVAGDVRLTYAELDARADRAARLLRGAGVGPGAGELSARSSLPTSPGAAGRAAGPEIAAGRRTSA
ncbi:hypothetical protein [Frankia sp. AgB32]|uniref:hypothetical protein n=1 Tax=Frankia sp. AgB32 TaxID=631119 RepID=UPI00200FD2C0|nr:hypothetical protein [Frankia sp. AgB32]MCK9893474.1 hypothetical protein [Frankia sp. AgB32]